MSLYDEFKEEEFAQESYKEQNRKALKAKLRDNNYIIPSNTVLDCLLQSACNNIKLAYNTYVASGKASKRKCTCACINCNS